MSVAIHRIYKIAFDEAIQKFREEALKKSFMALGEALIKASDIEKLGE